MSVAQAFAQFDANTMIDNALARVRRSVGVRTLAPTTSVRDYLDAQGLLDTGNRRAAAASARAANDTALQAPYLGSIVGRRHDRRARRALRA